MSHVFRIGTAFDVLQKATKQRNRHPAELWIYRPGICVSRGDGGRQSFAF